MAQSDPSPRFRELLQWMLTGDGRHGAVKRVAERLGVPPTDVPKILAGKRKVGWKMAERAAARLEISPDYFSRDDAPETYFRKMRVADVGVSDGVSLRSLRPSVDMLYERFSSRPHGDIDQPSRDAARAIVEGLERSALLQHRARVLQIDPRKAPMEYDRALFDLLADLRSDTPAPNPPRVAAERLRAAMQTLPPKFPQRAKLLHDAEEVAAYLLR